MKISEPTTSHLLRFPSLSQWKITVCSLYYSSMNCCRINVSPIFHFFSFHMVIKIIELKQTNAVKSCVQIFIFIVRIDLT